MYQAMTAVVRAPLRTALLPSGRRWGFGLARVYLEGNVSLLFFRL